MDKNKLLDAFEVMVKQECLIRQYGNTDWMRWYEVKLKFTGIASHFVSSVECFYNILYK